MLSEPPAVDKGYKPARKGRQSWSRFPSKASRRYWLSVLPSRSAATADDYRGLTVVNRVSGLGASSRLMTWLGRRTWQRCHNPCQRSTCLGNSRLGRPVDGIWNPIAFDASPTPTQDRATPAFT